MTKQKDLPGVKRDPDNYRKLSEPFASQSAAQDALDGFWKEFYELRNKWRLADVVMVIAVNALDSAGEEKGQCMVVMHAGNELMKEPMLAFGFGKAQQERKEMLARVLAQAVVATRSED